MLKKAVQRFSVFGEEEGVPLLLETLEGEKFSVNIFTYVAPPRFTGILFQDMFCDCLPCSVTLEEASFTEEEYLGIMMSPFVGKRVRKMSLAHNKRNAHGGGFENVVQLNSDWSRAAIPAEGVFFVSKMGTTPCLAKYGQTGQPFVLNGYAMGQLNRSPGRYLVVVKNHN